MRHWLSGLLAALLVLSLTACGDAGWTEELPGGLDASLEEAAANPEEDLEEPPSALEETPEAPEETSPGAAGTETDSASPEASAAQLAEDGVYTTKEDVALYLHQYGRLPGNFITKKEAQALGWSGGSLEPYAPGKCIGGSHFGNYEGLLPEAEGRRYTECDIDTLGADSRGAKRIVFSNDGLIYYTDDHYASFTLLYGEAPNE